MREGPWLHAGKDSLASRSGVKAGLVCILCRVWAISEDKRTSLLCFAFTSWLLASACIPTVNPLFQPRFLGQLLWVSGRRSHSVEVKGLFEQRPWAGGGVPNKVSHAGTVHVASVQFLEAKLGKWILGE